MDIRFSIEKEGRDEVEGDNKSEECGVDIPVSKYLLKLSIKLLKDGGRFSRHCWGERKICRWPVQSQLEFGEINVYSKEQPYGIFTLAPSSKHYLP